MHVKIVNPRLYRSQVADKYHAWTCQASETTQARMRHHRNRLGRLSPGHFPRIVVDRKQEVQRKQERLFRSLHPQLGHCSNNDNERFKSTKLIRGY